MRDWTMVGARLYYERVQLGLSREKVAEQLGVSATTICAIEDGDKEISIPEIAFLADLYKTTAQHLTSGQQQSTIAWIKDLEATVGPLSPLDRGELLRFADFLAARNAAKKEQKA